MNKPTYRTERRQSHRRKVRLDAELAASLSILEADYIGDSFPPLVFMGKTQDLSATGLAFVLPAMRISEGYCGQSHAVTLALHLPTAAVQLEIEPIRCVALNESDPDEGYLMGARIRACGEIYASEWQKYLNGLGQ